MCYSFASRPSFQNEVLRLLEEGSFDSSFYQLELNISVGIGETAGPPKS